MPVEQRRNGDEVWDRGRGKGSGAGNGNGSHILTLPSPRARGWHQTLLLGRAEHRTQLRAPGMPAGARGAAQPPSRASRNPGKSQSRKIPHIPANPSPGKSCTSQEIPIHSNPAHPNPLKSRTSQEIPMRLNPQHPRKSQSLQLSQGQFGDRELTDLLSRMMARVPKQATKFPHPQNPGGHQDLYSPPGGGKSSLNSLTVPKNSKK